MIADLPEMHDADMAYDTMTGISHRRWGELLANIASLLPAGAASVVVDGPGGQPEAVADRLAATLRAAGRPCSRLASTAPAVANADCDSDSGTVVLADGPGWRAARGWDVVIWLRTDPAGYGQHPGGEAGASIVIDLHDPAWPHARTGRAARRGSAPALDPELRMAPDHLRRRRMPLPGHSHPSIAHTPGTASTRQRKPGIGDCAAGNLLVVWGFSPHTSERSGQ